MSRIPEALLSTPINFVARFIIPRMELIKNDIIINGMARPAEYTASKETPLRTVS